MVNAFNILAGEGLGTTLEKVNLRSAALSLGLQISQKQRDGIGCGDACVPDAVFMTDFWI